MYKRRHGHGWKKGWRMTGPRYWIMDIFKNTKGHFSAEEVYDMARKLHPGIGIATVYRTLDFLTKINYIKKYFAPDGKARYEYLEEDNEHYHFICRNCGKIMNAGEIPFEVMQFLYMQREKINASLGTVDEIQIRFLGLCNECKENRTSSGPENKNLKEV